VTFAQIARVLEINGLQTITNEVVETARASLVIGPLADAADDKKH